ncbi:MAG: hypothetical protein RLZZ301_993 [Bacteroidota bacterium]|jgi:gliding motility-associated-like protein
MRQLYLVVCLLIACIQLNAQSDAFTNWSAQARMRPASILSERDSVNYEKIQWQEVLQDRSYFSAAYVGPKGEHKLIYSQEPLHFLDDSGHMQKIDSLHPSRFYEDGSFGLLIFGKEAIRIGRHSYVNDVLYAKELTRQGKILLARNSQQHLDQQVILKSTKIVFNYRLTEKPSCVATNYILSESLELPPTWKVNAHSIVDGTGQQMASFGEVWCYDAAGASALGQLVLKSDRVELLLPNQWLQAAERSYPVIIDPLIAGTMSTWTGGQMPSCFIPAYNKDSIQVTIPGGISLTGLYVDASFYADPFSFATMAQGAMYFSTSCGASQIFTVTGSTATLPGTAYLDSFNLMNPLSCCYQESCNPIQFWVRMHLGRNANGSGCNTSYIRYDPFTTTWPFQVIVYGRSPESYGNLWYTSQTPICSNTCSINATAYARYGVAPYTFSHPWTNDVTTTGQNVGCSAGATNHIFQLTLPNCPIYCDSTYDTLSIPPPIIVDACGTYITAIPAASKPLKAAIAPDLVYDSVVCDGNGYLIQNEPCISDGVTHFMNTTSSGFGSVSGNIANTSDSIVHLNYSFYAERLGCISDTITATISIVPNPHALISMNPNPVVVTESALISSASSSVAGIGSQVWSTADSSWQAVGFQVAYDIPGSYPFCLLVSDLAGCIDSSCANLLVVPASIENINVITPNGDGLNDTLAFQYLEFYPQSQLTVLNRWGVVVYEASPYTNNWSGGQLVEGTYFYNLKIPELNQTLQSFFQIERK